METATDTETLDRGEIALLRQAINLLPSSVKPADRPRYRALYSKLERMHATSA